VNFYLYSPVHFENWDFRNSVEKGIGGSETSHVEMAWRLARRGHQVTSYAPIPADCPREWKGTNWLPLKKASFKENGIWIIYRSPETLDKFPEKHPNQQIWLMMQDESYPTWTKERAKKVDKVLALCPKHLESTKEKFPYLKNKLVLTSNGIKMDLIRDTEKLEIKRNPKKLIYASSPDRGLYNLLKIFRKAREIIPDLQLHVFYGFDNINKLIKFSPQFTYFKKTKKDLEELMKQPGVKWHGRVSQEELYKQWFSTGIWCYPTNFTETSCITCMEAQACGAIPLTNPLWALQDNVMSGSLVNGNADDSLNQARYVGEICRLASQEGFQDQIRPEMMNKARFRFNWERWVDQWEAWIYGLDKVKRLWISQFNFQLKYAKGKILNIGCDVDPANFKALKATNLDVVEESPILKVKTKADIIADVRDLPESLTGKFDTVILGDILEHLVDDDIVIAIYNAKQCLKPGGQIVITCPDDPRPADAQHKINDNAGYAEGVSSYHERPISKEYLEALINSAGCKVKHYQEIDYTVFKGHGYVVI